MPKSTRQYVFDGIELIPDALIPFVEKRLESTLTGHWQSQLTERVKGLKVKDGEIAWDQQGLFRTMIVLWSDAFATTLGHTERTYVSELLNVRNQFAHNEKFTYDDAERALDTMRRLVEAIGAGEVASKIGKMRDSILRMKFTELQRNQERRKTQRQEISVDTVAGLVPWREVVEPHDDVAKGDFQQAEFAADLGKVHKGSAPPEYSKPKEFFSRTYLTDGLSNLLEGAAKRLSGQGGDPVVGLQTNFGGGKTHSMLALYHMVGDIPAQDLSGLDQLLTKKGLEIPKKVSRAVIVGTSHGAHDIIKEGKREIKTTWGELAWQLGGAKAFDLIADNDANGIAPGSNVLENIFNQCAPCLILIDEWVAYLRQIYKTEGLPSGSFDANLTFVQSLTEAVKASPGTLLVASLPASEIEVGGEGGKEALKRLSQTFSRVEASWRPASQEESYEIVRRRLFKEIPEGYEHKDNALKQFYKLYRDNSNDFPQGCADEDYRRKMDKAYPIHPELFDHLYEGWGSLENFQRTRGVLRLMAQVIHELWMDNDPSIMIMPGSVPISSERIVPEILHYLDTNWESIIAADIDGASSTPYKIDKSAPNLNRTSATRRVARAVFMGSAPTHKEKNRGLDDKRINLGVVQPGERPTNFGDALRRLTNQAKFMHSDSERYWYSTSASLNRLATDYAGQLEENRVLMKIDEELKTYINSIRDRGHFDAVQVAPTSSADVPDDMGGVRAVILGVAHPHTANGNSKALNESRDILMQRGSAPRVYRNTLVFLAAENKQIEHLKDAVRFALAWDKIVQDKTKLDLTQSDSAMAETKAKEAKDTMTTRLRECWCYLLYPHQETAESDVEWASGKVSAQDGLLARASKNLESNEGLLPKLGPTRLDRDLQKYIWNGKPHLHLKDLWEYLNRYTYLPRLKGQSVLVETVAASIGMLDGPFVYAERWDETTESYSGLLIEKINNPHIVIDQDSVIIKPEIAEKHRPTPKTDEAGGEAKPSSIGGQPTTSADNTDNTASDPETPKRPTRFRGAVEISSERPARDMQKIVEAIVEQLTTLPDCEVNLKLEIDATSTKGFDSAKTRTLLENANTLGFLDKKIE